MGTALIWDSCLCRAVAEELTRGLGGTRARSVNLDRGGARVSVYFRESTWVTDLSAGRGWTYLVGPAEPPPDSRPLPAVLSTVEALPDERVLIARFRRIRGSRPHPSLVLELTTNRFNALWVEGEDDRVVARLRMDARRPHKVGQPWTPPGPSDRAGIDGELPTGLVEDLWDRPAGERRRSLLTSIAHLSSLNVNEILQAGSAAEAERRWRSFALLEDTVPGISILDHDTQPYPWPLERGRAFRPTPSLLEAMGTLAGEAEEPGADPLLQSLGGRAAYLEKRIRRLEEQMTRADRATEMRDRANLILANLHAIPGGAAQVTVIGLTGETEVLELDPSRRPQDQADALFKRAGRMERAQSRLPEELDRARTELAEVEEWTRRISSGSASEDDRARLRDRYTKAEKASREGSGPGAPYRTYRTSGGLDVWVGRNSKRNDELTFRHARPGDVWMHARHASGAHVVLRWDKEERPPKRDLEEAAVLAALHSKARGSGQVPVDWTRRRYVRKLKGAPAGTVRIERHQTLFVTPDPEVEAELRTDESV